MKVGQSTGPRSSPTEPPGDFIGCLRCPRTTGEGPTDSTSSSRVGSLYRDWRAENQRQPRKTISRRQRQPAVDEVWRIIRAKPLHRNTASSSLSFIQPTTSSQLPYSKGTCDMNPNQKPLPASCFAGTLGSRITTTRSSNAIFKDL